MSVEHSLASLLQRVADLEAALRPFARLAEIYAPRRDDVRLVSTVVGDITVGDIRRARRVVED